MEISIRDIIKAILVKWYIMLSIVSIFLTIGTIIGVNNYNKPKYSASTAFLFSSSPTSNINLYVNNCRVYLLQEHIKYKVSDSIKDQFDGVKEYEVTIEAASAIISVKVTAENEEVAVAIIDEYSKIILAENNPIKGDDLVINVLVPTTPRRLAPSFSSLIIQISLFGFAGVFLGGIIILTPLYNEKAKEERKNSL